MCRYCSTRRLRFVVIRVLAARGEAWLFASSKLFLDVLPLLVIQLIDGLHRFAGNQARNKTGFIRGQGCQHVDPCIQRDEQVRIKTRGTPFLGLIDHFEHVVIGFGNQANLSHRGRLLLRYPNAPQLAHSNLPLTQFGFPDAAEFKDQQVAPPRFVQVVGSLDRAVNLAGHSR